MANTQENKLKGKVAAYQIVYLPKKVEERGKGITVTKERKLGAFLVLQVDSKRYMVPSKSAELVLGDALNPTPDLCKTVTNILVEKHPINSEREFTEYVTTRGKAKTLKRYELSE